jgi:uncharacterized protein YcfJ
MHLCATQLGVRSAGLPISCQRARAAPRRGICRQLALSNLESKMLNHRGTARAHHEVIAAAVGAIGGAGVGAVLAGPQGAFVGVIVGAGMGAYTGDTAGSAAQLVAEARQRRVVRRIRATRRAAPPLGGSSS